jgi:hypothetical protein
MFEQRNIWETMWANLLPRQNFFNHPVIPTVLTFFDDKMSQQNNCSKYFCTLDSHDINSFISFIFSNSNNPYILLGVRCWKTGVIYVRRPPLPLPLFGGNVTLLTYYSVQCWEEVTAHVTGMVVEMRRSTTRAISNKEVLTSFDVERNSWEHAWRAVVLMRRPFHNKSILSFQHSYILWCWFTSTSQGGRIIVHERTMPRRCFKSSCQSNKQYLPSLMLRKSKCDGEIVVLVIMPQPCFQCNSTYRLWRWEESIEHHNSAGGSAFFESSGQCNTPLTTFHESTAHVMGRLRVRI